MPVARKPLAPFWTTTDGESVRLYHGHVTDVLARLPERSVHCVVTSPPYWGLRDYGTGTWSGGDPACEHKVRTGNTPFSEKALAKSTIGAHANTGHAAETFKGGVCPRCGATRTDQQLGSEPSPDCDTKGQAQCGRCFVCAMVAVFRGVRRVLRDDGTVWLNLGDTYASGGGHTGQGKNSQRKGRANVDAQNAVGKSNTSGLPSGNLVGVPWRVALALQADGWVLRSDIPWVKRSCMPESTSSRPTKALEYVFLLTKHGSGYFYDADAVRKAGSGVPRDSAATFGKPRRKAEGLSVHELQLQRTQFAHLTAHDNGVQTGRNFRNADLWFESVDGPHGLTGVGDGLVGLDVTSQGYEGAHFATFPPKLIEPMILAGTSEYGCCVKCGAPWRRVTERVGGVVADDVKERDRSVTLKGQNRNGSGGSTLDGTPATVRTVGWEPTCGCGFYRLRDDVPEGILKELRSLGVV